MHVLCFKHLHCFRYALTTLTTPHDTLIMNQGALGANADEALRFAFCAAKRHAWCFVPIFWHRCSSLAWLNVQPASDHCQEKNHHEKSQKDRSPTADCNVDTIAKPTGDHYPCPNLE